MYIVSGYVCAYICSGMGFVPIEYRGLTVGHLPSGTDTTMSDWLITLANGETFTLYGYATLGDAQERVLTLVYHKPHEAAITEVLVTPTD